MIGAMIGGVCGSGQRMICYTAEEDHSIRKLRIEGRSRVAIEFVEVVWEPLGGRPHHSNVTMKRRSSGWERKKPDREATLCPSSVSGGRRFGSRGVVRDGSGRARRVRDMDPLFRIRFRSRLIMGGSHRKGQVGLHKQTYMQHGTNVMPAITTDDVCPSICYVYMLPLRGSG